MDDKQLKILLVVLAAVACSYSFIMSFINYRQTKQKVFIELMIELSLLFIIGMLILLFPYNWILGIAWVIVFLVFYGSCKKKHKLQ